MIGLSYLSFQLLKDSQMDRPSLKPQHPSHWYNFIWSEIHFPSLKTLKWSHGSTPWIKEEIPRRNRLWVYVRCFSYFFSHFLFFDTQTHTHTYINIYIIYADIDGILWVERGGRCLEGSISLPPDLCYYRWNVAFSLETVKRVLRPQKKRCLQNYLLPHICS